VISVLRNPQGGGIDGQDSLRKTVKSRQPLNLGKVVQGLSPNEQRRSQGVIETRLIGESEFP
jgi:hypothetical protein